MHLIHSSPLTLLLCALPASLAGASPLAADHQPAQPSDATAQRNAFHIFNSVHSAMRQWGSSIHHNGLALIPATVPEGTLFYHGSPRNATPPGPEWLAFEIEHAESFARPARHPHTPPPGKGGKHPPPPPGGHGPPSRDGEPAFHRSPSGFPKHPPNDHHRQQQQQQAFPNPEQKPLSSSHHDAEPHPSSEDPHGYLHIYQAARPLRLLYVDGMSGGKTSLGTLDTQDLVLLRGRPYDPSGPWREAQRAKRLCAEVGGASSSSSSSSGWGYDGVLRMEMGFEVILCDFASPGAVSPVDILRRPREDGGGRGRGRGRGMWDWARAAAERYDGIGAGRARLDFSGMVSGLWYEGVNVTNPDAERREMPRLVAATGQQREVLRARAEEVARRAGGGRKGVDWQGVVDMIVSRYADRLALLAQSPVDVKQFVQEVFGTTDTHFDYPASSGGVDGAGEEEARREADARQRCSDHYLLPTKSFKSSFTTEDHMLYTAIKTVSSSICHALFEARSYLQAVPGSNPDDEEGDEGDDDDGSDDKPSKELRQAVEKGQEVLRKLVQDLAWAGWKKCKGCGAGEICFVAMWPFGSKKDHYEPRCRNASSIERPEADDEAYWNEDGL